MGIRPYDDASSDEVGKAHRKEKQAMRIYLIYDRRFDYVVCATISKSAALEEIERRNGKERTVRFVLNTYEDFAED